MLILSNNPNLYAFLIKVSFLLFILLFSCFFFIPLFRLIFVLFICLVSFELRLEIFQSYLLFRPWSIKDPLFGWLFVLVANKGIGAYFEPIVWLHNKGPESIPSKPK
jgi:hypothetical protein